MFGTIYTGAKQTYINIKYLHEWVNKFHECQFENKIDKISVLNPINTLKRGYTVSQVKNKRIDTLDDIEINDKMITILKDGKVISTVKEKIYEKNSN